MNAYANICPKCDHEAWRHGLVEEPEHGIDGPYRCVCGCEIFQSDPVVGLTKKQYEVWKESHPITAVKKEEG